MITTSTHNSARRVVFGALAALLLLAFIAPTAHAETYSYWSLWESKSGTWSASQTGASDMKLADESVIAAKYVTTEETLTAADAPTQSAEYKTLCPDAEAATADAVNVAVVLDYGDPALVLGTTPQSAVSCVAVATPATGATALSQVSRVTSSVDGFITAINGYPSTETATTTEDSDTTEQEPAGLPILWIVLGIALLVLIVIVAITMIRRRNVDNQ